MYPPPRSLAQLQDVLQKHPQVADVAVLGLRDQAARHQPSPVPVILTLTLIMALNQNQNFLSNTLIMTTIF